MKFDIASLKAKKVLGVPVLYLMLLGAVVLMFFAWRMKSPQDDIAAGDDATDNPLDDPSKATDADYSSLATNGTVTVTQGSTSTTEAITVQTNERWLSQGVNYLIAQGLAGGGQAQVALQKYLNGEQLSYSEGQLRDAVIKQYGLPPESISAGGTSSDVAKRQGNPPTVHTVKSVGSDDTYNRLAGLYYGNSGPDYANLIIGANRNIPAAGVLPVGTRVTIPVYTAPRWYTLTKSMTLAEVAKKNGTSTTALTHLNPGISTPIAKGKKVRVA